MAQNIQGAEAKFLSQWGGVFVFLGGFFCLSGNDHVGNFGRRLPVFWMTLANVKFEDL